jgi:hypothetical protein
VDTRWRHSLQRLVYMIKILELPAARNYGARPVRADRDVELHLSR